MFQTKTNQLASIAITVMLCLLPANSVAQDANTIPQAVEIQTEATPASKRTVLKDMSFQDIRREAKAKISNTQTWARDHQVPQDIKYFIDDVETATDRFQDSVAPAGRSIKSFVGKNLPGKKLAYQSDSSVTVYGILLILALAFVFLFMNLANPVSRLGGRH